MAYDLITQLNELEEKWWEGTIKEYRSRLITEPRLYADSILAVSWDNKKQGSDSLDETIRRVREEIWQLYLLDEAKFHAAVLAHLFTERDLPKSILDEIIDKDALQSISDHNEFVDSIGRLIGDYAGRVMPYVYQLALSTTQSRRSRAGRTFEQLIESLLDHFDIPFDTQGTIASNVFTKSGLGKKVDAIVPGVDSYIKNRSKCAVVTMKTTLRERWQEVAEELSRTNIPHIYLLTADENVTENVVNTVRNYNITLVVYASEKNSKFTEYEQVISFYDFFTREMKFIAQYWD